MSKKKIFHQATKILSRNDHPRRPYLRAPNSNSLSLHYDGSEQKPHTGPGFVFRDKQGNFVAAGASYLKYNKKKAMIMFAEMEGAINGYELAVRLRKEDSRFNMLMLVGDCEAAVHFLRPHYLEDKPPFSPVNMRYFDVIKRFRSLYNSESIKVTSELHTRDGNMVADLLEGHGRSLGVDRRTGDPRSIIFYSKMELPDDVISSLDEDNDLPVLEEDNHDE